MPLPEGFQARACPFCNGREVHNIEVEVGIFKIFCGFCGGHGPEGCKGHDEAWLAWNGMLRKAPASAGMSDGVFM